MDGGEVHRRGRGHLLQNLTSDLCSTHQKTPYKQIWIKLANINSDYLSFFLGGGTWGGVGAPNQKSDFRFVFYAKKKTPCTENRWRIIKNLNFGQLNWWFIPLCAGVALCRVQGATHPNPDLYSKLSSSTSFKIRSHVKSVALYFSRATSWIGPRIYEIAVHEIGLDL